MKTPSPEISDAERAVQNYKHELMVRVMSAIIHVAFKKPFFSPADIDPDIVPESDRQGCLSNAWSTLHSLEIIERLPMGYTDPSLGIFGGRIKNTNESAKGRFTGCYRLVSRSLAETWLARNGHPVQRKPAVGEQLQMV